MDTITEDTVMAVTIISLFFEKTGTSLFDCHIYYYDKSLASHIYGIFTILVTGCISAQLPCSLSSTYEPVTFT